MFIFYDFEVFKQDWIVVFVDDEDNVTKIHNDRKSLSSFFLKNKKKYFVGFNNYYYDDIIMSAIMLGKEPYQISTKIIDNDYSVKQIRTNFMSLDVIQELRMGVGLKEIEANLSLNIHETPVDFNIKRKLTKEEVERTFDYCYNDVLVTRDVFRLREAYFTSKFEVVKEFKLKPSCIKFTRAKLASEVLQCTKQKQKRNRLNFTYDKHLNKDNIPKEIIRFYEDIRLDYLSGENAENLEKKEFKYSISGVEHSYGFGGLHGAIKNYVGKGLYLAVDVSSYYPSLMINNGFISSASKSPELFKNIYEQRMYYKYESERLFKEYDETFDEKTRILAEEMKNKADVYKIILNATFGAMKSKYNPLFDPVQANNICINGQLILTDLALRLSDVCELIQSNTDGIIVKYEEDDLDTIMTLCQEWEQQYMLDLDYYKITSIAQRDVNNYAIRYADGKIKTKGRFANWKGGTFDRTSLSIIDMALTNYYMNDIPIEDFVFEQYRENNILPFQIIAKMGGTFYKMIHQLNDDEISLQKVNRAFATHKENYGQVLKVKRHEDGSDRYNKIANTSEHTIIHNEEMEKFDKSVLDLQYYIDLIKSNLIKE